MKYKLLLLLLWSGYLQAQPGYTKINSRYDWLAGRVDSGLHVPGYNGTPVGVRSGVWVGDGAIAVDTLNHLFYYYSGGIWRSAAATGTAWDLLGNSGTSAGTNFIGTRDNNNFSVRTNNNLRARFFQDSTLFYDNDGVDRIMLYGVDPFGASGIGLRNISNNTVSYIQTGDDYLETIADGVYIRSVSGSGPTPNNPSLSVNGGSGQTANLFEVIQGSDTWVSIKPDGSVRFNGSAGTSGQVLQSNGTASPPTWTTTPSGITLPISSLTAPTGTNTLDIGNFPQIWTANTLAANSALKLSTSSTAAATNGQVLLEIDMTGVNATSSQVTRGMWVKNSHGGSGSNYGIEVNVSGGSQNTGVYATSASGQGIYGSTTSGSGVYGNASGGSGVRGTGSNGGQGVLGENGSSSGYGVYASNGATTGTGIALYASSELGGTNVAAKFSATGGTNNYALVVASGEGSVGIGTSTPTSLLHVNGVLQLGTATSTLGQLLMSGNTSGTATIVTPAVAGTPTITLPTVTGTIVQYINTTTTSDATPDPTGDAKENNFSITALAADATFSAPSGTPSAFNTLLIRVKDNSTVRALAWNAIYRAGTDIPLPTTTVDDLTMYIYFVYNSTSSTWDLVGLTSGF